MKYTIQLLGAVFVAITLSACSHTPENTYPKLKVKAKYFSVRNDIRPSRSSNLTMTTELSQKVNAQDGPYRVLLGQGVGVICSKPDDCSQSSNLAILNYTLNQEKNNLVIRGRMTNETGVSTTSQGGVGSIKWDIPKGAKLYSEGTVEQEFILPITKGSTVMITGPLEDKLVLSVE